MGRTNRILFFEDDSVIRDQLEIEVKKKAPNIDLIMADSDLVLELIKDRGGLAIEDTVALNISDKFNGSQIDLIVADHDLSKLDSKLSESIITAAAHQLAIPVCRYHRRASSSTKTVSNWDLNSKVFAVDVELGDEFADSLLDVMEGFKEIKEKYSAMNTSLRMKGPAAILANILEADGQIPHLSLYTSGVAFFNDPFIVSKNIEKSKLGNELERRIPYVLGYWLLNVVLKFPGIILNKVAAASYLDLSFNDFSKTDLNGNFSEARYAGPFSHSKDYWWRAKLDDLLGDNEIDDFLKEKGYNEIFSHSKCSVNDKLQAGYYDIFSDKQISLEESVGQLSWVPEGADLARAEKEKYEELAPILNL